MAKEWLGRFLMRRGLQLQRIGERFAFKALASEQLDARVEALKRFWFLADSPLYIDDLLVEGLFDAIFRPEFEASSRTVTHSKSKMTEDAFEIALAGEASVPALFKMSATGKSAAKSGKSTADADSLLELAIKSPERRLEKLIALYAHSYPNRALWVEPNLVLLSDLQSPDTRFNWEQVEQLLDAHAIRPLVVLDLTSGAKLLPMFAELTDGSPLDLYHQFLESLNAETRASVPPYPKDEAPQKKQAYWSAYESVFDSRIAMGVVETAAKSTQGARIEWIDYRVVGYTSERKVVPIHLHLTPRGRYPAGTFAYQFIRRGFKYGLRIIGTLKKGYDMNVLAIYER